MSIRLYKNGQEKLISGNPQGETLPVGSEIDFDGTTQDIPAGWEQVEDKGEIYSTDEVRVGTWLGKPLYRKVVNLGTITVAASPNTFNTGISNIENVIKATYTYENSGRIYCYWTHILTVGYIINTNQIELWCNPNEAGRVLNNFKIIIEYTKTTDTVQGGNT